MILHLKDGETEAREREAQEGTVCWCHNWTRKNPLAPGSRIARAHCKKNWLFLVEIEVIQIFIHVLQEKGMKAVPQRLQGPHSSGLSRPQLKFRVATFVTKIK